MAEVSDLGDKGSEAVFGGARGGASEGEELLVERVGDLVDFGCLVFLEGGAGFGEEVVG